jgi:hypothetical protein
LNVGRKRQELRDGLAQQVSMKLQAKEQVLRSCHVAVATSATAAAA